MCLIREQLPDGRRSMLPGGEGASDMPDATGPEHSANITRRHDSF